MTDQSRVSALDDAKTMMLVTRRVETDNRPDVAAAADETFRKPSFTALVTHDVRMPPNVPDELPPPSNLGRRDRRRALENPEAGGG